MNSKQVRHSIRVQSPCSPAYRTDPSPTQNRRPVPLAQRWAIGQTTIDWGWRIAYSHFTAGQPLPSTIQDRAIRRAYFFLRGAQDEMMAITLSLREPGMEPIRFAMQGLLCARDVTLDGIALLLELPGEVVEIYGSLFFPVRTRGISFLASLAYPQGRLGAIREAETGCDNLELTLMRLGRDYGWQEVARFTGLAPIEGDKPIDDQVEDLERLTFGNALMVGRVGGLNRRSEGLQYAKSFIAARRSKAMQKDDDSRRGLAGMSLSMSINESFMRVMAPDLAHRLAIQSGIETEDLNKPKDTPPPTQN